ncbi:MAG TPA: oligosaccharide flippase family protein [Solirubrobacteraceae bacterium]|nr:oligosaccharide flippase family protein [Solirubrobacteraceae bacterium]
MDGLQSDDVLTNEELTRAAGTGLRWIAHVRIAIEVVLVGGMVVLARMIPPSEFGIFAIVVIVQELALTMPMEGIGSAIVQRRTIGRNHLQGGMVLSLLVGGGLTAITLVLAVVLVQPVFGERVAQLLMLATPWYLLGAIYAVPVAILRRRLDFARLSLVELGLHMSRIVVTVALAFAGLDAEALVLGSMAGMATALVLALWFAPPPLPRWRSQEMRELLPYGGPAALACVAWTGFRNGDYAIIGATLGTAQAGFYWRGYQVSVEYQGKISALMRQMAFPMLARTESSDQMHALRRRMVRLLTVVLFPLLVGLALMAPVLVPWVFGSQWEPAVLPTQILALGGAAVLVTDAVGSALMADGRSRALLGYGVAHFVTYAGTVLMVASHGLAAVAIAASVVHTVFLLIAYQVLLRAGVLRAARVLWGDVAPAAVACGALIVAALPADWALASLDAPAPVHLAGVGAAGALAYLLAIRAWFPESFGDLCTALRRIVPDRVLASAGWMSALRPAARRA